MFNPDGLKGIPLVLSAEQPVGAIHELPLQIIPNPAAESFTVHCPDNSAVTVRDVFGRIVLTGVGRETFPTYNLPDGVYFVEVSGAGGVRGVGRVVVGR